MSYGDPIPFDVLQEQACLLTEVPWRCDEDRPPGCVAADQLIGLSRELCAHPRPQVAEIRGPDVDRALHVDTP